MVSFARLDATTWVRQFLLSRSDSPPPKVAAGEARTVRLADPSQPVDTFAKVQIRVEVTVAMLDRVVAECHAIGAAIDHHCTNVEVRSRERRNRTWVFSLVADHPEPGGEVLNLRR